MRTKCAIENVAGSSTRPDALGVEHHEEQINGHARICSPRLAFTIDETAYVLGGVCPKTVHRLIARRLLHPSRGLRCPLIPIWEIVRYLAETGGCPAKDDDRFILLFYKSLIATGVDARPSRTDLCSRSLHSK